MTAAPRWRLVDRLLAGYGLLVTAIAFTRLDHRGIIWVMAAHLAIVLLAWLSARLPDTPTARVLGAVWPIVILPALYSSIDILNGFGAVAIHDATIQRLEYAIFAMQPARDWWRLHPSTTWSAILHATYLSYYLIVPLPLIFLAIQRRWDDIPSYLAVVIAVYLFCYLWYILWPVAGPYYEFARPSGNFVANLPARAVYGTLASGSSFGAAFPSSHVAATLAAALAALRVDRYLGVILIAIATLLTIAVVYCQMHYAIDSAAGMVVALSAWAMLGRNRVRLTT